MSSTSTDQHPPDSHQTCPYLGTFEDAEAWYGFPDSGNYCYRAKPPGQIDNHHQKTYCLSPKHINCQLLLVKQWNKSLPKELSYREDFDVRTLVLILLTLIFLVVIGVLIYYFFEPTRQALADFMASSTPARITTLVQSSGLALISSTTENRTPTRSNPLQSSTAGPAQTYTPAPLTTNTPTQTLTLIPPTLGPEIGTPFGPQRKYVLHIVQESEPLSVIAPMYRTSVEAIRASNFLVEGASIWPGKVLVVVSGVVDVTDLIKFCAFYLDTSTTLSELARFLGTSEEELIRYNNLNPPYNLPGKRWMIFPFQESTDPKLCK